MAPGASESHAPQTSHPVLQIASIAVDRMPGPHIRSQGTVRKTFDRGNPMRAPAETPRS